MCGSKIDIVQREQPDCIVHKKNSQVVSYMGFGVREERKYGQGSPTYLCVK